VTLDSIATVASAAAIDLGDLGITSSSNIEAWTSSRGKSSGELHGHRPREKFYRRKSP
jgi:hypothetical protein